jgi:F-type H+-transporting ATPase subunit c
MISTKVKFLLTMAASFVVMGISSVAFAQGDAETAMQMERISNGGVIAIACGLAIGLAAFGGALGQGRTAAAALEGIARNPNSADRIFTPMILGLALIESLVIYALVIAIMLQGKIG